ncbi:keratin, type I cytoskeletal 50 kDa-like [Gossypium australe]|uniref:Keratin, type I cytoskeletal 50 kDa-like n=1 Tax=Gossypium australe TaxID=47621 RepID=A0A5B6W2F9_9ROSI|nr:keratin, type I cytoskeletal 50 kDa-like [Gossypium australe]
MAAPTSSNLKCFKFIFIAIFCCNVNSGNAQNFPAQSLAKAFFCFTTNIYTGCDEAYRLNERCNLNVPREATDIFCNEPCFAETQLVLKCVDNILSDFIFYNKATIGDVTMYSMLVAATQQKRYEDSMSYALPSNSVSRYDND